METWRKSVIEVALGKKPADLVIRGGKLVNVNTREIYPADVAVVDGRFAIVGDVSQAVGPTTQVVDAEGLFMVPGFIECHWHTEDSQVTLTQLSRVLLPHGVTSIMYAHEIANVFGVPGQKAVVDEARQVPLKAFFEIPPSVPWARGLENTGVTLSVDDVREMLSWKEAVSLGESDIFDIINLDPDILAKFEAAHELGKPVNGHAAMVSGAQLMAVIAGGFHDDHENYFGEELLTKARLGLRMIIREFNIPDLVPALIESKIDTRNMMFAIDDKPIHYLAMTGGVDSAIRTAISSGLEPLTAIQMGTINAAIHFRKDHDIGSISPGRIGDVILTDSLENLTAHAVIANGKLVARDNQFLLDLPMYHYPDWMKHSVKLNVLPTPEQFEISPGIEEGEAEVRLFVLSEHGFVRVFETRKFPVRHGKLVLETTGKYNRIAVIERHSGNGRISLGLIDGFGMKKGAMASTIGHDSHNITIIGTNNEDMAACADALVKSGGGYVAVVDGKVVAQVELEIAGLITEEPYEKVIEKLGHFEATIRNELGFPEDMMFLMITAFVFQGTPFLTAITDVGLVDTYSQTIQPLIVSTSTE
jgi:adenine deaminase